MRDLIEGADLAIANFENPAPNTFRYHTSGTVFSADPKLIKGLANAGIDWVGLANNHIGDAGGAGILQTIKNLKTYGIASSGAGKDLTAARKPAMLKTHGVTVAMLAYDTIAGYYAAGKTKAGSAKLTAKTVKADVAAARKAGADVVIVFPHWGTEYDPTPFAGQKALAQAAIDAGADMVIGNHAHWAGAVEVYKGKPIWYALGNFVFDQTWSEPTMEGITLELTFRGKAARPGPDAAAHHPRQGAAEPARPGGRRPGGDGPGLRRLEGPAALVGPRSDDPGEEVRLGQRGLDARLAQDVGLLAPVLAPAVLAEEHERAVRADLGDVLVDGVPLAVDRVARDVEPGRDPLVGDQHLGGELLELGELLRASRPRAAPRTTSARAP